MTRTSCPETSPRNHGRDERIVELLRALVRVNTEHAAPEPGAPYGRGCARALDLALGECERAGLSTHRVNEKVAWAQVGTSGPLAAFPVHLDVVPAGDGWGHDPYGAEVADGVLYGRGCVDNKMSAAILMALLAERAGRELPCRLRIIFGTDEETGMSDLHDYVETGEELPSLGFVPDASFPVVRGEKARLHLRVSRAATTVGLTVRGGSAANVVPAEARATLPDGRELATAGRPAHGSTPERGESAVRALVRELVAAGVDADGAIGEVGRLLCADLTGAALGIDVPDETFGHTSMNLGTLELADGILTAELDVRFGSALVAAEVVARVRAALGGAWEVDVVREKPLHLVSEDDACVRVLLAAYERVTGERGSCSVMAGGTYASYLPGIVAFGPKFPGTHCGAHGVDEHVRLADVARAADIYREAIDGIVRLAASREE